jgi:rod shape determining protein RodA
MIWDARALTRLDLRAVLLIAALMCISILTIASATSDEIVGDLFLTPTTKAQLRWFAMGWGVYLFFAGFDYRKLRSWTWPLYIGILFLLVGLFFTTPIQNVHRWYKVPLIGIALQPSEYAKLVVVIALSWYLERKGEMVRTGRAALAAGFIVLVPFALILKQPDLGTALILYPITLVMFYFAGIQKRVLRTMSILGGVVLVFVGLMFSGVLSHDEMRPYVTNVIKEYQYERLNPNTYHQQAAQTAVAIGGVTGSGWRKSEFTGGGWLPESHTDSVFAAYSEEFGLIGVFFLLLFFFGLIYFSFQVTAVAKDRFGRLLSSGITVCLAMHVIVNIGMMCGCLPITGVPLILVTYGGSSILSTMMSLGILQSIYTRRFMF